MSDRHQVIIVGGGAGGLELATRLGDRLGRKGRAAVTLVDRNETHLWKPLLHEVAAGSMRSEEHTSELQSRPHLVCRLLLEKKNLQRRFNAATPLASNGCAPPLRPDGRRD